MRRLIVTLLFGYASFLSGCSLISKGEYFTAHFECKSMVVEREDWLTDTSEPSFGSFRPPLREVVVGDPEKVSFVVYPIIIREEAVSFGPAFLPIIPVLKSWQDPPSPYTNKIKLLFKGENSDVDGLKISVNGNPILIDAIGDNGTVFVFTESLDCIESGTSVLVELKGSSLMFFLEKERMFCFAPFTSFN